MKSIPGVPQNKRGSQKQDTAQETVSGHLNKREGSQNGRGKGKKVPTVDRQKEELTFPHEGKDARKRLMETTSGCGITKEMP